MSEMKDTCQLIAVTMYGTNTGKTALKYQKLFSTKQVIQVAKVEGSWTRL